MLKRLIFNLLERRHYWRYIDFEELAELYVSRTLRMLAVSMVSMFVVIYMYQNHYDLSAIMLYFTVYYAFRAVLSIPSAHFVARFGPKHANLCSNLLYVPALISMIYLPEYKLSALIAFGVFQAISMSLYDVSYLVNFSKIKHDKHAGKEISYMHVLERVATSISPVIGGVVAFLLSPQATLIVASCVFALAALPLLMTPEPVKTRQKITFRGLPWSKIYKGLFAEMGIGTSVVASTIIWPLFVAISVFGVASNAVYAQIGVLGSITIAVSVIIAKIYGSLVDRKKGGRLLLVGVWASSIVQLARPLVATPMSVLLVNIMSEMFTTAYIVPFSKGLFDMADSLAGFRIVYVSIMNMAAQLGAALFAGLVAVISLYFSEIQSMSIAYWCAAFIVLGIGLHGFPALRERRFVLN